MKYEDCGGEEGSGGVDPGGRTLRIPREGTGGDTMLLIEAELEEETEEGSDELTEEGCRHLGC